MLQVGIKSEHLKMKLQFSVTNSVLFSTACCTADMAACCCCRKPALWRGESPQWIGSLLHE